MTLQEKENVDKLREAGRKRSTAPIGAAWLGGESTGNCLIGKCIMNTLVFPAVRSL